MELAGYFEVAKRWWATLLIATWVAGLAGYLIASEIPPTYEGEVHLLVGPVVGDSDTLRAAGAISYTYAELATSGPALERASEAMGLAADTEIVARAIPNETTRILAIRAQHGDPEVAATIANVLADQLIAREAAGVILPEGQLSVVDEAVADPDPIAPQVTLIAMVAAGMGLLAAAVLVLLVDYFGNTVNSRRELRDVAKVPLLGFAALGQRFRPTPEMPTIVEKLPDSRPASAVRFIATKLAYADPDHPTSTALIVGCATRDGSADLTLGLAAALAGAGRRVIAIDANDEHGDLSLLTSIDGTPGVAELLDDPDLDLSGLVHSRPRGPALLSRGRHPRVELVDPESARTLARRLAREYEVVLITTAPIHHSGNGLVWARAVERVVVAVERDRAKRDDVSYAFENLAAVRASVLGTVLLDHAPKARKGRAPRARTQAPYATRSHVTAVTPTETAAATPSADRAPQRRAPDQASR